MIASCIAMLHYFTSTNNKCKVQHMCLLLALCDHASIHNVNQIDNVTPTIHRSISYQYWELQYSSAYTVNHSSENVLSPTAYMTMCNKIMLQMCVCTCVCVCVHMCACVCVWCICVQVLVIFSKEFTVTPTRLL